MLIVAVGAATVFLDYVFSVLLGFVNVIDNPARQTFVMEMVGREELPNAVGLNSVVMNSSRVVGSRDRRHRHRRASGSRRVSSSTPRRILAVLLALWMMNADELRPVAIVPRAKGQLREGFRYVWSDRMVRTPLMMMAVIGTLAFNFQVVIPLISTKTFGLGAGGFGRLTAAMGAGAVFGGLAAASRRGVSYRRLLGLTYAMGVSILLAAVAPTLADRSRHVVRHGRGVVRVHRDREHHPAADGPPRDAGPGHGAVRDRVPRQHTRRQPDHRMDLRGLGTAGRLHRSAVSRRSSPGSWRAVVRPHAHRTRTAHRAPSPRKRPARKRPDLLQVTLDGLRVALVHDARVLAELLLAAALPQQVPELVERDLELAELGGIVSSVCCIFCSSATR